MAARRSSAPWRAPISQWPGSALSKSKDAADELLRLDLVGRHEPGRAVELLRKFVEKFPDKAQSQRIMQAHPTLSPFGDIILDSDAAIADYEALLVKPPGAAIQVLDHSAVIFYKDGKHLRWVHEILAIRSREAAEKYGEIGFPDDARVVELYTRKSDGRRLYAESVPEKDTLTRVGVESDDYIVAVYLVSGDNGYLYDRGYLAPREYFQGTELPIFRQRFEVYGFGVDAPEAQQLAGGPDPLEVSLGGRKGVAFEARNVDFIPPESGAPPAGLWLPSVQGLVDALDVTYALLPRGRRRCASVVLGLAVGVVVLLGVF